MSDMKRIDKMTKGETQKVETYLEKGPSHIVRSLIGISGSSGGDVLNFIVKSWISQNIGYLANLGIEMKVHNAAWAIDQIDDEEGV